MSCGQVALAVPGLGPRAAPRLGSRPAAGGAGGVLGVIALAATDHRHRAVMLLVAVLVGMGIVRLWTPGRPWFASRGRLADAIVYVILAAIIWYLAPFVSTMAVR